MRCVFWLVRVRGALVWLGGIKVHHDRWQEVFERIRSREVEVDFRGTFSDACGHLENVKPDRFECSFCQLRVLERSFSERV